MQSLKNWHPQDEIEFMRTLTVPLVADDEEISSFRPHTRLERLDALKKHLAHLRIRHFPAWAPGEVDRVICEGEKMLAQEVLL